MSSGARRSSSRREFLRFLGNGLAVLSAGPMLYSRTSPVESGSLVFTDITEKAGLAGARNVSGSGANKQFLLEEMGGGVALFDYDNDGWLDIFLVNGTSLDPGVRDRHPTSFLFHNNRDGTFTDVTRKA